MKHKTDELTELFEMLNLDAKIAGEMRCDFEAGDAILDAQSEPELSEEMIGRITQNVQRRSGGLSWAARWQRIAAVLVLGFVLVGLVEFMSQPVEEEISGQHVFLLADDYDVLETALDLEQEEFTVNFDDPEIADILSLWDDAGWDVYQLFGKDFCDEKVMFATGTRVNCWIV